MNKTNTFFYIYISFPLSCAGQVQAVEVDGVSSSSSSSSSSSQAGGVSQEISANMTSTVQAPVLSGVNGPVTLNFTK